MIKLYLSCVHYMKLCSTLNMEICPPIAEMILYVSVAEAMFSAFAGQECVWEDKNKSNEARAKCASYRAIINAYQSSKMVME